jgi:hypothetical protein
MNGMSNSNNINCFDKLIFNNYGYIWSSHTGGQADTTITVADGKTFGEIGINNVAYTRISNSCIIINNVTIKTSGTYDIHNLKSISVNVSMDSVGSYTGSYEMHFSSWKETKNENLHCN